ncbi:MAG: hypothetical protein AB7V42_16570 [Thermoleophilia bacterium]
MSRCIAIAAHGKRCQQSPFKGSPYCWHHTHSRKVWAPSRPRGSAARASEVVSANAAAEAGDAVAPATERRPAVERRGTRRAELAQAERLVRALGESRVTELLEFLEAPTTGAYLLIRDETGLITERSVSESPASRRRASA